MLNGVCLLVNSCLKGKDGRDFCIALWLGTKNGFIIPSAENHGEFPAMLPCRRPNRIFKVMLCIWLDQLGVVYYELLKPTETITDDRFRTQLMRLSRVLKDKRPQYNERHEWFCSMTILNSMLRKWSRHIWKRCNGKSYPTRRILQTLLPLTFTCFDQWHTAWLTSTSGLMKK